MDADGVSRWEVLCPRCSMALDYAGANLTKGPGHEWAHAVYYGGDFGYWCVFAAEDPELVRQLKRIEANPPRW